MTEHDIALANGWLSESDVCPTAPSGYIDCGSLVMNGIDNPHSEADQIPIRRGLLLMQEDALFPMARDDIELGRRALVAGINGALVALGDGFCRLESCRPQCSLGAQGGANRGRRGSRGRITDERHPADALPEIGTIAAVELDRYTDHVRR